MSLVRIDHQPSNKQLTVFASLWLLLVGGWALTLGMRNGWTTLPMCLGAGALLGPLLKLVHREPIRILYLGACYLTLPIGWVVSHVLLATIYYGVMTPIGLIMRMVGYDPMARKIDRECESYWIEREQASDSSKYFKQF